MIRQAEIASYASCLAGVPKLVFVRDETCGFSYGPSFVSLRKDSLGDDYRPNGTWLCPHWWASCTHCHRVALCTWQELSNDQGCDVCWSYDDQETWTARRDLRVLRFQQEAATSAFLLGGVEAVALLTRPEVQLPGAHVQEAVAEEP